jgi:two-component system sensor kinase FixL
VKEAFKGNHIIFPPLKYDTGQTVEDFDLKLLKNFKSPWIQSHLNAVKDANGEIDFIVNTYVDITDLKYAEQETKEQKEVLARIDRASSMGQLTGSIAHELNQPLTGILSNAQAAELMLKGGDWEVEDFKEILTDIINDTKRGGEVIHNLRELFRGQKVEFIPFDINEIINDTIHLLNSEFVMQHVVISVKSGSSIPSIKGNKIQIQQVLVNLIMNGIQAMENNDRDKREIQIQTTYNHNEVSTSVTDSGTGIYPNRIDHIFEPLATWKPGGTGMGLAISNSIVESHGGRMWAENRKEGGALVGFALPLLAID